MLFYVALTVMLGAVFKRRGGVIGIPLGVLFGQQYVIGAVPALAKVLPWGLALPIQGELSNSVAGALLVGRAPETWLPVTSTAILTVVFVVVAVWRFREVEL